jgi:hypothetical protein
MSLQSEEFLNHMLTMNSAPPSRDSLKLELAAETLLQFSEVRFVAHGTSMLPSIYPGDCLTANSFGSKVPRCGDIVLCRRAGEFRVHRIVDILDETSATLFILRGDALLENDPPVSRTEILGRVTSLLRRGKSFDLDLVKGLRHLALRSLVRRSKFSAVLLLRWNSMQAGNVWHAKSLPRKSAETTTEST